MPKKKSNFFDGEKAGVGETQSAFFPAPIFLKNLTSGKIQRILRTEKTIKGSKTFPQECRSNENTSKIKSW